MRRSSSFFLACGLVRQDYPERSTGLAELGHRSSGTPESVAAKEGLPHAQPHLRLAR